MILFVFSNFIRRRPPLAVEFKEQPGRNSRLMALNDRRLEAGYPGKDAESWTADETVAG
jgi:hypothetical protein